MSSLRNPSLLAITLWALSAHSLGQVTVTHIANEGFLLSAGEKSVLVDALFDGLGHYERATPEEQSRLQEARGAYEEVDLLLATHFHDDHFSPGPVRKHLENNPDAFLISTPQALGKLNAPEEWVAGERVRGVFPPEGSPLRLNVAGIAVDILNLHHGRGGQPEIQNLGYIIHLGGLRILHVGDTEATSADLELYPLLRDVDIAILPGWFLSESRWSDVNDYLRPRRIVVMHLAVEGAPAGYFGSAGSRSERIRRIRQSFPESIVLQPGESHVFEPR